MLKQGVSRKKQMAEASGPDMLSIWQLRIDPRGLAMWSPFLVALKSCLGEVRDV